MLLVGLTEVGFEVLQAWPVRPWLLLHHRGAAEPISGTLPSTFTPLTTTPFTTPPPALTSLASAPFFSGASGQVDKAQSRNARTTQSV